MVKTGNEAVLTCFKLLSYHPLGTSEKITKNFRQNNNSPFRDSNPAPPEHKAGG